MSMAKTSACSSCGAALACPPLTPPIICSSFMGVASRVKSPPCETCGGPAGDEEVAALHKRVAELEAMPRPAVRTEDAALEVAGPVLAALCRCDQPECTGTRQQKEGFLAGYRARAAEEGDEAAQAAALWDRLVTAWESYESNTDEEEAALGDTLIDAIGLLVDEWQGFAGARADDAPASHADATAGESIDPTKWAVHCPTHRRVYLTEGEHTRQLARPGQPWTCPRMDADPANFGLCGEPSDWCGDPNDTFEVTGG